MATYLWRNKRLKYMTTQNNIPQNDNDQVLCESSTLRTSKLELLGDRSEEILGKAKAIHFNVWQGVGAATTEQVAAFYEVPIDTVNSTLRRNRKEFISDGIKVLKGGELKMFNTNITSDTKALTVWNPRSTLRLGYLLRDSVVAKAVRTTSLDIVENIPASVEPTIRQLPPPVSIYQYMEISERWGLATDPLIKSLITQRLAEELGSKALPDSSATQVVLTVRAGELGYNQSQIGSGSQLGKFISRMIPPNGKTQHGRYPVNVYDLTPELDECIHAYFR